MGEGNCFSRIVLPATMGVHARHLFFQVPRAAIGLTARWFTSARMILR